MDIKRCLPLEPSFEDAFYALAAEYLPGTEPETMRRFAAMYPKSFIGLFTDAGLTGVAFGWPRNHFDPEDPSFCLDGIAIMAEHWRRGNGRYLLSAFEQAARAYGASVVSVGSAGGWGESFYIGCGYRPIQYKSWQDGGFVVEHVYSDTEDYLTYRRKDPDGFVVMEKQL